MPKIHHSIHTLTRNDSIIHNTVIIMVLLCEGLSVGVVIDVLVVSVIVIFSMRCLSNILVACGVWYTMYVVRVVSSLRLHIPPM